jgi:tripartite-type tricarboxylate transporter receptor subunit TctC
MRFPSFVLGATLALSALISLPAAAQEWPARPVRLVVPVPTGGALDPFARAVATKLSDGFKQQFIVDNKPGASGSIATAFVAKSAPDGYTFGFVYDTHTVNPALIPRMSFDTLKDLAPVMLVGTSPLLVATNPSRPYRSFGDLVAAAKAKPDSISIGSTGNGSLGHLALLQLARVEGIKLNHVPYKGGGPLVQDLVGGQIDLGIAGVPNMVTHVKNKLIRPLVVTTEKRSPALPDVPTLSELGINGVTAYTWWGLLAPAGTPKPILDRFHAAMVSALESADMKKLLNGTFAMETIASTPEALQEFVVKETATWARVVRENNVRPD